jgi:pullulanase/glycogen debranching enzyme
MLHNPRKVVQAWLETPTSGSIELDADWRQNAMPDLQIQGAEPFDCLSRMSEQALAGGFGYFLSSNGRITFVLFLSRHPEIDEMEDKVYLAGDFNGWQYSVGREDWELRPACFAGELALVYTAPSERFLNPPGQRFKFVTAAHYWLPVPADSPNASRDEAGNVNHVIDSERTGKHLFQFLLKAPLDLSKSWTVGWTKSAGESAVLRPDGMFFNMRSSLMLGSMVRQDETIFRLFAPRAQRVELCLCRDLREQNTPLRYPLTRCAEPEHEKNDPAATAFELVARQQQRKLPGNWRGVWAVTLDRNLRGWYYWYHVEGPSDCYGLFNKGQRILDPYAYACVSREGPGIVIDRAQLGKADSSFKTPDWQNLIVAEAHVRDLLRYSQLKLDSRERLGFAGLQRWVESPDCYLHRLGVNCVELQPIHENDSISSAEYHWGYMPVSWFAPASTYSSDPNSGSGIQELRSLVEAFHRKGMAVIIDVVFNHQGVPAHLMFVDKLYYFMTDRDGHLSNWSGCGNDFRANSAMAKRLIIDSCMHMIDVFGIDGFRFDLAELLGVEVLQDIERALKTHKHDVILIAEPWSFRGHIAGQLSETGWSSWNDGYRNFMRDYMKGGGSASRMEYYLKGSPWYFARWPAQTVNYTESHDDRTWLDMITENGDFNGTRPTAADRRRTHLMAAVLFCSLGIPMITAGQDFLRSKRGVNNTYLDGETNGLDYRRLQRFSGTHGYFADWIAFRLSERGRLLRLWSKPSEGYFAGYFSDASSALALLYNADGSQGSDRLLFAINATDKDVTLSLPQEVADLAWLQIADHERFNVNGLHGVRLPLGPRLELAAMTCSLWIV